MIFETASVGEHNKKGNTGKYLEQNNENTKVDMSKSQKQYKKQKHAQNQENKVSSSLFYPENISHL